MKEFSKEQKMMHLAEGINTIVSMASDLELPEDQEMFDYFQGEYEMMISILADYSTEEAANYSDDFMFEVNKYNEEFQSVIEG